MSKSPAEMTLNERKTDLIWRMFIEPADGNYLSARWAYDNGLFHQFYWNAAQSIEKYIKSALLLNNHAVKDYQGHNLIELLDALSKFDTDGMLPISIDIPNTTAMGREDWHEKPYSLFIDYLDRFGSADNRYGNVGTFINGPVISIFDQYCCILRKFIRNKNFYGRDFYEVNNENQYFYDQAPAEKEWMISPIFLLERLYRKSYSVGQDKRLRRVFSNMNLSFFDEREEDETTFGGLHIMCSPVYNHFVRLLDQEDGIKIYMSKEQQAYNRDIIPQLKEWAIQMIRFSKRLKIDLKLR